MGLLGSGWSSNLILELSVPTSQFPLYFKIMNKKSQVLQRATFGAFLEFTLKFRTKNHKYYNERRLRETLCPIPDFTLKSWINNHKYYTNITTKSTSDSKFVLRMQFKKCEFSKIVIKHWNEQLIRFFDFDQTFSISIFNHDFWEYDSKTMNSQKSWLIIETTIN